MPSGSAVRGVWLARVLVGSAGAPDRCLLDVF